MSNEKVTIFLSSSRSLEKLKKAADKINSQLFGDEIFVDDRIELTPVMNKDGELIEFKITATPLSLFQLGLRYGALEEAEYLSPYMRDFYKDIVSK